MFDIFDIIFIICIAIIFKYSGNLDVLSSIIFSVFIYYVVKLIIRQKYCKDKNIIYEIKGLLNIDDGIMSNEIISESFEDYKQRDKEGLYKI